jgi:hypothetical protein
VGEAEGPTSNPKWFLGLTDAFHRWVVGEEHPAGELRVAVGTWIASLPDRPWQHPSVPMGEEGHPRYDRRGARIKGVGVTYTVDEVTGQIDLDLVGREVTLPTDQQIVVSPEQGRADPGGRNTSASRFGPGFTPTPRLRDLAREICRHRLVGDHRDRDRVALRFHLVRAREQTHSELACGLDGPILGARERDGAGLQAEMKERMSRAASSTCLRAIVPTRPAVKSEHPYHRALTLWPAGRRKRNALTCEF